MPGATRRIDRGSGHSYVLDGEPVAGVTTILSEGVPKPGLIDAAARETANYAVNNWDTLGALDLAQRLRKVEKGRYESWNRATVRGTKVHAYAAALMAGEEVDVPDQYVAHVDQCLAFMADFDVTALALEVTVINRQYRYMGALDLLATLGDAPELWLLDWKTSASGVWPEVALQLAAYAHCSTMLDPDGAEVPLPPIARAGAVHLRADGYDLLPVDVSDDTFRTFLYVQQVAQYRAQPRSDYIGDRVPVPQAVGS
jgi:hypothetical protein